MLDNVTGIIISAADLRSAPEEVRNWILGLTPDSTDPEPTPEPASDEPTEEEFSMPKFMELAKSYMASHGPPAMLSLLRDAGAERVSQCSEAQARMIIERMESHEQSR